MIKEGNEDNIMVVGKPTIGQKMRRVREIHGFKQGAVANTIGVSQQTISDWEKSEIIAKASIQKYAEAIEVGMDEIVNFEEKAVTQFFSCTNTGNVGTSGVNNIHNTSPELIELIEKFLQELKGK